VKENAHIFAEIARSLEAFEALAEKESLSW
jgi:hypothetical protein